LRLLKTIEKAASAFTSSITLAYRLSTCKLTLSDLCTFRLRSFHITQAEIAEFMA